MLSTLIGCCRQILAETTGSECDKRPHPTVPKLLVPFGNENIPHIKEIFVITAIVLEIGLINTFKGINNQKQKSKEKVKVFL